MSTHQTLETEAHPNIAPRRVKFDLSEVPIHWIPNDPVAAQIVNVLHLLLPSGEKWFGDVLKQDLASISDPVLRSEVKAFVGQEAIHGRTHEQFRERLAAEGFATDEFVETYERFVVNAENALRRIIGADREHKLAVSVVAAIEHFTAEMGEWVLRTRQLDDADPVVMDMLRWHGAEEMEHKCVAFDAMQHVTGGSYIYRLLGMAFVVPVMSGWWIYGSSTLLRQDRIPNRRAAYRAVLRSFRTGRLPSTHLLKAPFSYLRPGFHPSQHRSLHLARAYLDQSPVVAASGRGR